jgi:hypothetical protein
MAATKMKVEERRMRADRRAPVDRRGRADRRAVDRLAVPPCPRCQSTASTENNPRGSSFQRWLTCGGCRHVWCLRKDSRGA